MVIWHLYVFDFVDLENFPTTSGFLRAPNEAVFRDFFGMVNLGEIFYVTKVMRKILLGGRSKNFDT